MDLGTLLPLAFIVAFVGYAIYANVREARASKAPDATRRCHACGYDLRASTDRCPECGELIPRERRQLDPTKLRDHWPPAPIEPRTPALGEERLVVWHAPSAVAAQLLVNQLEARGVLATIGERRESIQPGTGYAAAGSTYSVVVCEGDRERVEAILKRFAPDDAPEAA